MKEVLNKFVPKKVKNLVGSAVLATSAAFYGGALCDPQPDEVKTPTPVSFSGRDGEPFLKLPMPRDEGAKIAQGWKYTVLIRGTYEHQAVDFILGSDVNNADTWRPFPVLAAADGLACASKYMDSNNREANYIEVLHDNGYKTRYLHNEGESLLDREYPSCASPSSEWLKVRQGDKLSEAGDAGTEKGWIHLHWEVIDRVGRRVDPYDLYTTRDNYPDPNFLNGKKCGERRLIINCPVADPLVVPTIADVPTREPFSLSPPLEAPMPISPPNRAISPPQRPFVEISPPREPIISPPYSPDISPPQKPIVSPPIEISPPQAISPPLTPQSPPLRPIATATPYP